MSQYLKPNPTRLQEQIKHVVVLMLENHSFDHMLGWLYEETPPPNGQQYEGLNWNLWNPLDNIDADGKPFIEKVPIEKNGQYKEKYGKPIPNPVDFTLPNPDPGEGYRDTNHQLFLKYDIGSLYPPAPINFGFVQNYQNAMLYGVYTYGDAPTDPRHIMKCYTPEQTPVLSELARSFAVCDHYHCSVPSQTIPNRDFIHAATSTGHVNNSPIAACDARTIFNQIQDAIDGGRTELSWGIFGNNDYTSSKDAKGKFGDNHFSLTRLIMTQLQDSSYDDNFDTLDNFKKRCKTGDLPSYSFLEPNYGGDYQNDQHPPADIRPGEQLIADIYNAIKTSKAFNETLFIITYDEHGGCYDHVAPPEATNPYSDNRPGQEGFRFNRFGVRVPCVVVNPYIVKGLIARPSGYVPFDHTSVIKTVQTCFQLEGSLTERDKAAPDFSCLLGLTTPRTDFPTVKPLKFDWKAGNRHVNDLHRLIAKILEDMTGNSQPDEADLLEYIEKNYNKLFNTKKRKSKSK
jgi:phospholipase C